MTILWTSGMCWWAVLIQFCEDNNKQPADWPIVQHTKPRFSHFLQNGRPTQIFYVDKAPRSVSRGVIPLFNVGKSLLSIFGKLGLFCFYLWCCVPILCKLTNLQFSDEEVTLFVKIYPVEYKVWPLRWAEACLTTRNSVLKVNQVFGWTDHLDIVFSVVKTGFTGFIPTRDEKKIILIYSLIIFYESNFIFFLICVLIKHTDLMDLSCCVWRIQDTSS